MATKMKRLSLYLRTFILLVWTVVRGGYGYSCPYGQHCAFEPAPPGRAPPCAMPGLTYCLHPDPYPEKLIRQLVDAGRYDIRTLLSDETRDDFNSHKKNDYPYEYGPNSLPHVDQISLVDNYPKNYNTKFHTPFNHEIFNQKTPLQPPAPADPYNLNVFQSSNFTKTNGFHNFQASPGNYWNPQPNVNNFNSGYEKKYFKENNFNQAFGGYNPGYNYNAPTHNPNYDTGDWFRQAASSVTQYNPVEWWKYLSPALTDVTVERSITFPTRSLTIRRNSTAIGRARRRRNAELVEAAAKRKLTGAEALKIALGLASAETSAERPRRQTPGTEQLCQVRTQFITPRAALNNKGSWKYVVNMPDNMTQLVKAEICTSTECSGLCSVPLGYSTRCEQKYIQKRLVALESNGQNLYTDIFWIPSCCQCTILSNN